MIPSIDGFCAFLARCVCAFATSVDIQCYQVSILIILFYFLLSILGICILFSEAQLMPQAVRHRWSFRFRLACCLQATTLYIRLQILSPILNRCVLTSILLSSFLCSVLPRQVQRPRQTNPEHDPRLICRLTDFLDNTPFT